MKILLIALLIIYTSLSHSDTQLSDLTEEERRMLIASLNLGQCVLTNGNFLALLKTMDMTNMQTLPDSDSGRKRIYDPKANAMLQLSSNDCIVEVIADDYEKFISGLQPILEVTGGKLTLKAYSNGGHNGSLVTQDKTYRVVAFWDNDSGPKMLTAAILNN